MAFLLTVFLLPIRMSWPQGQRIITYPPDLDWQSPANGADYLYSLLTSYEDAPAGTAVPEGMYYNAVYSGYDCDATAAVWYDVEYADGADTSMDAVAKD